MGNVTILEDREWKKSLLNYERVAIETTEIVSKLALACSAV